MSDWDTYTCEECGREWPVYSAAETCAQQDAEEATLARKGRTEWPEDRVDHGGWEDS